MSVEKQYIAVVRIRGRRNTNRRINDTISMLNLRKQNYCVVIENSSPYLGMLQKARNYITWGEINEETLAHLVKKRGRLPGNKRITEEYLNQNTDFRDINDFVTKFFRSEARLADLRIKKVFRLKPPSKGYERKGIKTAYFNGGATGYRGEGINDLLLRMI
ncbi:MAG: 50S ribosomal protein L30 [Candidatus Odinarchaeota archaeon]